MSIKPITQSKQKAILSRILFIKMNNSNKASSKHLIPEIESNTQ